jgi:cyclohexanone monooxygenase
MPSMKYAMAQEIRAHNRRMGKHWDLYPHAIWQTGAKEMRWDDKNSVWVTTSDRGDTIRSKFLVTAGGPLNVPHLPNIEGIETFKGHQFHTSRWDYSYTGGNADEGDFNMTGLNDKKVAFVG